MKSKQNLWIIILLIILILVLGTNTLTFGRSNLMHSGYGKMGPGMMGSGMFGFGWIIPVIIVIVVIAAGVWLGNFLSSRGQHYSSKENLCPNCSRQTEFDWNTCPYCSEKLK
jgi:uncharacterized membrane protein